MSIASNKRRARKRLAWRRFAEMIRAGGRIAMHPETFASLTRSMPIVPTLEHALSEIVVYQSPYIPRGQLVAMGPPPPLPSILDFVPRFIVAEPDSSRRLHWYGGIR